MTESTQGLDKDVQGKPETTQPAPQIPPHMQNMIVSPPRVHVASTFEEHVAALLAAREPGYVNPNEPFIVGTNSTKVINVEEHLSRPSRVRKNVKFTDAPSFLEYFKLFKDSYKPQIFCAKGSTGSRFLCVFDYDGAGVKTENGFSAPVPMWNTHRAHLELKYHEDYQDLIDNQNRWHSQEDFALFVEGNTHVFLSPDAATMLELAQHLKGVKNANWQSGKRLANGEQKIEYVETIEARSIRGEVIVPESIIFCTPIFDGYEPQTYRASFRWRMVDGKINFSYRLLSKLEERAAIESVKTSIAKETGLFIHNVNNFEGIVSFPSI